MNGTLHVSAAPLTRSAIGGRIGVVMHPDARALKERYEALAKSSELPADIEPYGEERASYIAAVNADRADRGLPPLDNDEDGNPELTERRRRRAKEFWEHETQRAASI